jgi:DNA-binding transcriptional ArsR family regulator
MSSSSHLRLVGQTSADAEQETLNLVFAALTDPVRREILDRLDGQDLPVSGIAAHFDISLQAVSRHIQVLVRAGLVTQQRTGRISRCRFDAAPIYGAALWLNRYSKYWQAQFDLLAVSLDRMARENPAKAPARRSRRKGSKSARGRKRARHDEATLRRQTFDG